MTTPLTGFNAQGLSGSFQPPVELSPRYWIPLTLVAGSLPLLLLQPIVAIVVSLFGLFLLYQAVSL
ncbi:MAG: DUF3119 family protein, partial [Prochlorotrichaceae cyanobacterium]